MSDVAPMLPVERVEAILVEWLAAQGEPDPRTLPAGDPLRALFAEAVLVNRALAPDELTLRLALAEAMPKKLSIFRRLRRKAANLLFKRGR